MKNFQSGPEQGVCGTVAGLVRGPLAVAEETLQRVFSSATGWLGKQETPTPVAVLGGLLSLLVGGTAAYCNFVLMELALDLILPIEQATKLFAIAIVSLAGMTGFLLHTCSGLRKRAFFFVVFLLWVSMEGFIGYERTLKAAQLKSFADQSETAGADRGSLVLAGVGNEPDRSPAAESARSRRSPDAAVFSEALLAAGLAALLAVASMAAFWAGFAQAGVMLTWFLALPVLAAIWVPLLALRVGNAARLDEVVRAILAGALRFLRDVRVLAVSSLASVARWFSAEAHHERKRKFLERKLEIGRLAAAIEFERKLEIERLAAAVETERAFRPVLCEQVRTTVSQTQKEAFELVKSAYLRALREICAATLTGAESEVQGRLHPEAVLVLSNALTDSFRRVAVNGNSRIRNFFRI